MTYYRIGDGKLQKGLFSLFFFLLLVLSRDTLYTTTILGFYRSQITMFAMIGAVGIVFLFVNRKRWKEIFTDKRILAVILSTLVLMIPVLIKRDFQTMNFSILLCVYVAIFFSYFIPYQELSRYFVFSMVFLSAYSLIACYILAPMAKRHIFSVPVVIYEDWRFFRNFVLAFPRIRSGYIRNFGLFREPGVYQYFINLAIFLNNYCVNWKKQWQMWAINGILAITMVSTFSTGGFVELVLMAVVLFFDKKLYKDKRIVKLVSVLGVAAVCGLIVLIMQKGALYRALREMIRKLFVINTSSAARYGAIFANLEVFLKHPLFGENIADVLHLVENNTSSTLLLYAVYGIVGGSLNVAGWVALVWKKERNLLLNGLLVVIMLMAINTQNLTTNVFFWLFPMMALVERGMPLLKKRG